MAFRAEYLLLGAFLLMLLDVSLQQTLAKKKPLKKDSVKDGAIEELQKQINDIVDELNHLKEQQSLQTVCLKGVKIHSKCYLAEPLKKRYHTASEDCNSLGGVLGMPTSADENDLLLDYIRHSIGPDEQVWLGFNDMTTENVWLNQDGFGIAYTNWDTSNYRSPQPDGGMSQNCAVMAGAARGKWFDENCREEKASVCQFNIV